MAVYKPTEQVAVTASEAQHYHELGLGRGINVTHSDMWKSRSPCLVRQAGPSLGNVISTKESGTLERYEKEVATVSGQLKKIRHSLHNPTALMKLGIDEQYSQSSCSTKLIKGKKIEKRTISFKSHFDDIQLYDTIDTATIDAPDCFLPKDSDYSFEENLASWFLKCIHDREKLNGQDTEDSPDNVPDTGGESQVKKLAAKLKELAAQGKNQWQYEMLSDAKALIKHFDITHYVSAITLGACYYRVVASRPEQKDLSFGTTTASSPLAEKGFWGLFAKQFCHKSEEQKIGQIKNEEVTVEAVIEFNIQPFYKLVRIQYIQMLLRRAVMEYIHSKEDASKGPYLISSEVDKKTVFWKVNDNHQLTATESVENASWFDIVSMVDDTQSSEFHIAHWGGRDKENGTMHVDNLYRTYNKHGPPLPRYLSADTNFFGQGTGDFPLTLKSSVEIRQARFCLQSRVQSSFVCMLCSSTPISLNSWFEGEQFFVKCGHHSFKMDGYIVIVEQQQNQYKVTAASGSIPTKAGLLFRLHPKSTQVTSHNEATEGTEARPTDNTSTAAFLHI